MPVPNSMSDLSPTAAGNSPVGGEPIGHDLDNYLRAHAAIIRTAYDNKNKESINAFDYGAVGDGVADDTVAVNAAIAAHLATGIPLKFNAGTFLITNQISIDVSTLLTNTGINISGAGRRRSILKSSYNAAVPFLVTGGNAFFHKLTDLGFEGNYAGTVLQIGKNDYSDAFNSCDFVRLNVNNSSLNAAAEGTRLNYVLQSRIDIVSNCGASGRPGAPNAPGFGSAIVLRQVQFSSLWLAGGNANIGLYLTNGYNFGNSFMATDLEEIDSGIKIDSANATKNIWLGGQLVATKCIDATAGASNEFRTVNISPYGGGSVFNGSNHTGVYLRSLGTNQAINNVQTDDALPGNAANLRAFGPDTDIYVNIYSKGQGNVDFYNGAGAQLFSVRNTNSAVNFTRVIPTTAGNPPTIDAVGSDTNIDHVIRAKGTGSGKFTNAAGNTLFVAGGGTSLVNFPQVNAVAAGNPVQYTALGSDTNIDMYLIPKGSGVLRFGTFTSNADAPVTGYVTIKDAGGTTRKLATIA